MRSDTIGTHKTTVTTSNGSTKVQYHSTVVAEWTDTTITLRTGGYFSRTTKTRMNQSSAQFDLGYHVRQRAGQWDVEYKGERIPFDANTLELTR